jgi:hypothetical protein
MASRVSPWELVCTRAAFARPGPRATAFPGFVATTQPSDSLAPSAAASVPLAAAYLSRMCLFLAVAARTCVSVAHVGVCCAGFSVARYR